MVIVTAGLHMAIEKLDDNVDCTNLPQVLTFLRSDLRNLSRV